MPLHHDAQNIVISGVEVDGLTPTVDTINEHTPGSGVTVDSVLHKDGGIVCADGATLEVDTINEATAAAGVTIDGVLVKDNTLTARRESVVSKSANYTCLAADSGVMFTAGAADLVFTLPATAPGLRYTFVVTAAGLSSGTGLSISPNASDKIMGNGFTSADDKDAINTGATDREGDLIEVTADAAGLGWYITRVIGTWARQA